MDEEDYVLEIQTLSKNFKNLNSRRDINEKFIFYYEKTPTETNIRKIDSRAIVKLYYFVRIFFENLIKSFSEFCFKISRETGTSNPF